MVVILIVLFPKLHLYIEVKVSLSQLDLLRGSGLSMYRYRYIYSDQHVNCLECKVRMDYLYLCGNIVVLEQKDGMINVTGQESPASQAGPEI